MKVGHFYELQSPPFLIQIIEEVTHFIFSLSRRKYKEKESPEVWKGLYKKKDAFLVHLFVVWWKRTSSSLPHHKTAGDNSIRLMRESERENLPPVRVTRLVMLKKMKRKKRKKVTPAWVTVDDD